MKETYLAGAAAALTVDILVYPLDTLKTRYQSQDFVTKNALPPGQKTLALKGLYQGIGSVVLATLPAAGIFFSTYESAKVFLSPGAIPVPEPVTHSLASATAEMASCLVLAPAEVIKQNAQMVRGDAARASGSASASLLAFRRLTQTGTAGRLFSGYTALVARNLPFTALQFPIFEYTRARLWRARARRGKGEGGSDERTLPETGLVAGVSAAFAGALAALLTTPSDVVKTRMMVQMDTAETPGEGQRRPTGCREKMRMEKKRGTWEVVREVFEQKGVRGFFRGGLFRSGATALGSGLYLGTYDIAKLFLERSYTSERSVS